MEKVKSNKAYKTEDLNRHVMILVAGTSDPGNIDDDGTKALSYGTAPTGYWDEKFVKELNEFDKIYEYCIDYITRWKQSLQTYRWRIYITKNVGYEKCEEVFRYTDTKPNYFFADDSIEEVEEEVKTSTDI